VSGDARATLAVLVGHGVVPVVRTPSAALARRAVEWLYEVGFSTFELTLTIPDALALVRELAAQPSLSVGVGTVLDAARAVACLEAGARYVVSPAVCAELVAPCREAGVPCVLGAATPSEVHAAVRAGAGAVKIFPVSSLGGVAHVKALKAVFPDVALVPTGGIGVEDIAAYLRAGSAFVGVGGRLVDAAALGRGDRAAIEDAARAALGEVAAARR
jgi:2-dehydro-3-deoxyphosphogluconate aldolase/(4S)-4-hydroxy-2-oxoglutarate aldolase